MRQVLGASSLRRSTPWQLLAVVVMLAPLASGCSSMASLGLGQAAEIPEPQSVASGSASELEKATEYWGKQAAKDPKDGNAALNYAKNLKAMGRKKEALAVLQHAHLYNAQNREHLSEYGRLALELGQISTAQRLLEHADDPAKPDWRVISARGTVLARQGLYKDAIPFFERARQLAPEQASVLNNLAMAYAMDGEAQRAETLLRQAAESKDSDPRIRHNLALVLNVQGKQDEAKRFASMDSPGSATQPNSDHPKLAAVETRDAALSPVHEKPAPVASPHRDTVVAQARPEPVVERQSVANRQTHSAARPQRTQDPDAIVKAAIDAEAKRAATAKPELMTGSVSGDNSDAERIIRAALQAEAAKAR